MAATPVTVVCFEYHIKHTLFKFDCIHQTIPKYQAKIERGGGKKTETDRQTEKE